MDGARRLLPVRINTPSIFNCLSFNELNQPRIFIRLCVAKYVLSSFSIHPMELLDVQLASYAKNIHATHW